MSLAPALPALEGGTDVQRILLAWDDRGHAEAASQWVRRKLLADPTVAVTVLYVTVLAASPRFAGPRWSSDYDREIAHAIKARLEYDVFDGLGDRVRFLHESGISVSDVIVAAAEVLRCPMIVLGGRPPRGLRRWVGGGVGAEVLRKTDASVLVIRAPSRPMPVPRPVG